MDKELLRQINPVYLTAKQTIRGFAERGDEDAIRIVDYLDKNAEKEQFMREMNRDDPISRAFMSVPEFRFELMNRIIDSTGADNVLDMPCGYTVRGMRFAHSGRPYIGADLPAAIVDIDAAVRHLLTEEEQEYVRYIPVDATNQGSLEEAVAGIEGSVCITTEGLLSYLTDSETEAVFDSIRQVLLKHGGCWVTPDREFREYIGCVFKAVVNGDSELEHRVAETRAAIGKKADSSLQSSSFFSSSLEESIAWAEARGFEIERIPMSENMPDLVSLTPIREGIMDDLRRECRDLCVWKLTAVGKTGANVSLKQNTDREFYVTCSADGSRMTMKTGGRIDTLTAPQIMEAFEEACESGEIEDILIDFEDLTYISSAGLRVLLIIFKRLNGREHFKLINCNPEVKKIFETTGFADIML